MRLPARRIAAGRAEGVALVSKAPFSFVGGADAATGEVLDEASGVQGERLRGCVFAFPHGKGSTVGSYVLYGLAKRGVGPAAVVNARAEAIVAVGAILGGIPMVDAVDVGALVTGDRAVVDADGGAVDLPDVRAVPVVTVFLRHRGRFLLVRRAERVSAFPGKWSGVSGYLEGGEDPRARARTEVREETGLRGLVLRAEGMPIFARHGPTAFVVHPFLFDAPRRTVRLDSENVEARWVRGEEIPAFDAVPRLSDAFASVARAPRVRKR